MNKNGFVVQPYIGSPLLLKKLKFDLRVYIVITGTEPLEAYICDEGLARFCTEEYKTPTNKNFSNAFMHLTNYSINKMSDNYVHPQKENLMYDNDGTKRTLSALYDALRKENIDVE